MNKIYNPSSVAKPGGAYSHGIEVPPNARWLFISGQLGITPEGKVREGTAAQAEQAWANIINILKDAGMGVQDLVKVTHYLLRAGDIAGYIKVRTRFLGDARPASMLLIVPELVKPEFLLEIEAIAARV